jgi:hypothetical protein
MLKEIRNLLWGRCFHMLLLPASSVNQELSRVAAAGVRCTRTASWQTLLFSSIGVRNVLGFTATVSGLDAHLAFCLGKQGH